MHAVQQGRQVTDCRQQRTRCFCLLFYSLCKFYYGCKSASTFRKWSSSLDKAWLLRFALLELHLASRKQISLLLLSTIKGKHESASSCDNKFLPNAVSHLLFDALVKCTSRLTFMSYSGDLAGGNCVQILHTMQEPALNIPADIAQLVLGFASFPTHRELLCQACITSSSEPALLPNNSMTAGLVLLEVCPL
jgi:hypothetical protein